MKIQGVLIAATVVNLGILAFLLTQSRSVEAQVVAPVLRGRALEIVDNQGRVRASINVFPTNPKFRSADGKLYPETVLLRLIDSRGGPNVKLSASNDGAALGLGGASNPT